MFNDSVAVDSNIKHYSKSCWYHIHLVNEFYEVLFFAACTVWIPEC